MQTEGSGGGKTCGRTVETGASVGAYLGVPPGRRKSAGRNTVGSKPRGLGFGAIMERSRSMVTSDVYM